MYRTARAKKHTESTKRDVGHHDHGDQNPPLQDKLYLAVGFSTVISGISTGGAKIAAILSHSLSGELIISMGALMLLVNFSQSRKGETPQNNTEVKGQRNLESLKILGVRVKQEIDGVVPRKLYGRKIEMWRRLGEMPCGRGCLPRLFNPGEKQNRKPIRYGKTHPPYHGSQCPTILACGARRNAINNWAEGLCIFGGEWPDGFEGPDQEHQPFPRNGGLSLSAHATHAAGNVRADIEVQSSRMRFRRVNVLCGTTTFASAFPGDGFQECNIIALAMIQHPSLYFACGTLTLKVDKINVVPSVPDTSKAGDGTLYNVYRKPLLIKSEFFAGMLALPNPAIPPIKLTENAKKWYQKAKDLGLGGTSDETAIGMPPQFSSWEIDMFLDFMYLQGWSTASPDVEKACTILKLSHYLVVETGMQYARFHLDNNDILGPVRRLELRFNYFIADWVTKAFDELMSVPINEIPTEDEKTIGWEAYRALAKAQAKVLDARLNLALRVPDMNHGNFCNTMSYCRSEWTKMWTGTDGDTPDKVSILREEEVLIDEAVQDLMRSRGIPFSKGE
ncbi:hypothetical protein B0H16DRAFT_1703766 [Mycena metata]|uniref:Uncharacterized protein n=1 Tax=Mycena metata TaxID=1033252 RepID=A0AAD7H2H5_9AGAR|nr:hypothetical protein B0H16DRAFT_1703766 [Mycena metata]